MEGMKMTNNIKKLRKEQGLSIRKLSKLTGLAPDTISKYEREERKPKIENWQKLANYFGVSVEYLQGKTFINKRPDKEEMGMGSRLRKARMMRRVTLDELSTATGFSTKLLSRFEDGLTAFEDKDLEILAHAVGASVEYLRGESDYLPELIRVVIFFTGSQKDKRYTIAYIDKELYKNLENIESGFLKLFWHDGNLKGYANVKEILYINEDETADEVGNESESHTWQLEEEPS